MPVRILVLPHLPYTGIRTRGWQMARALASLPGVEIHFASWSMDEPGTGNRLSRTVRRVARTLPLPRGQALQVVEGVRVRHLHLLDPGLTSLGVPLRSIRRRNTARLREAILRVRPDWVITGAGHTAPCPHDTGVPVAIDLFDDHFPHADDLATVRRVDAAAAEQLEQATLLLGASRSISEKYQTLAGRPVICIPNGHDLTPLPRTDGTRAMMRRRFDLPDGARVVVYPGNHGPHARLPFLVEVMRRARAAEAKLMCVLAGPIERRGDADLTRREPTIRWLGPLPPDRISPLLAASDVGILLAERTPFRSHALPIKVLEYGACGLPAVAPDLEELKRQALPHVRLVSSDDPDVWVLKLQEALETPFDADWARRLEAFAWPTLARRLLAHLTGRASAMGTDG